MDKIDDKVVFVTEEGEEIELYVIEQTTINGINYLLVAEEGNDDESVAYIMKDISVPEDEQAVYDMVEDEQELDVIGKVFEELLEDTDIVTE